MTAAQSRPRSHLSFERLVTFELQLITKTGLHVGAGKNPALVGSEMPILRDAAGKPLIPGSSLRGVIRSAIAGIVDSLGLDLRRPMAVQPAGSVAGSHAEWREFTNRWNDRMGIVERLFGRVAQRSGDFSYASRLFISDLTPEEEVVVELRDGVGIDRDTRTASAEGGIKFDLEVVPAGTEFQGVVRLHDPEDHEVGLLAQALLMLDRGLVRLGGKGARGLGWVEVGVGPVEELTAESLLFGPPVGRDGSDDIEYGEVTERLGKYLDELRSLARSAESAPALDAEGQPGTVRPAEGED